MDASNRDDFRVRTDLDEVVLRRVPTDPGTPPRFAERIRHARTERIDRASKTEGGADTAPVDVRPQVGDPWDPLTVHARLHRFAAVFRRLPHTPDTRPGGYRSCMPDTVREAWKDLPGEPMRIPVGADDYRAAMLLLDVIISLTDDQRLVLWGLALRLSNRRIGRQMRCHHLTVAKRKTEVLDLLASRLNDMDTRPDGRDVERAAELIHRNLA